MNSKKVLISLATVVAVAAGIIGISSSSHNNSVSTTPVPVADTPTTSKTNATQKYKDGSYTATGSYRSPGGIDNVGVTVTLKKDIVTNVSITPMPHDSTSSTYQHLFLGGYQSLVVGKSIDSIKLGAVSGSSLTGIGFNDAITQIKAQARI